MDFVTANGPRTTERAVRPKGVPDDFDPTPSAPAGPLAIDTNSDWELVAAAEYPQPGLRSAEAGVEVSGSLPDADIGNALGALPVAFRMAVYFADVEASPARRSVRSCARRREPPYPESAAVDAATCPVNRRRRRP